MKDMLRGKVILVTGGTGSIGQEIVYQLLKFDIKKIIIFSRGEIKQFELKQELDDDQVDFIIGDVRNYDSLQSVFENNDIDVVFHAAAMKHLVVCEDEPIECSEINIIGTHNLVRLCVNYAIKIFVMISTDKAASPTSVMGSSKFIAERISLNANEMCKYKQKFCCVRFGNVANSRGSVIPTMINRLINRKNIWVSNPNVTRFNIRKSEAVKLVLKAAEITQGGEIFVLKMKSFGLGDLVDVMKNKIAPKVNKKIKIEYKKLVDAEKLHEDLLNKIEFRNLLEDKEMFIVLSDEIKNRTYKGFIKSKINNYDSLSCKRISQSELEKIILEYFKEKKYHF
jgi:FlaA1/EpsC-like NDP-sugar epimerase